MASLAVQTASDRIKQFIHLARLNWIKFTSHLAIQGAMTCYQAATENEECKKRRKNIGERCKHHEVRPRDGSIAVPLSTRAQRQLHPSAETLSGPQKRKHS